MATSVLTTFLITQVQQVPFVTNEVFLGITGFLFVGLLAVLIYFVQRWIKGLDERDDRNYKLVEKTMESVGNLNLTLVEVNSNLQMYQETMKMTVEAVQQSLSATCERANEQDKVLQGHEIRIQLLEGSDIPVKKQVKKQKGL